MRSPPNILLQALIVSGVGAVLALAGNAVHPRGLELGRNYYPSGPISSSSAGAQSGESPVGPAAAETSRTHDSDADAIRERLAAKGLQAMSHDQFVALVQDPLTAAGANLLLDARREDDFAAGHIPGALHFDPFYPELGLESVLPQLPMAQSIVVYCNGGSCEDSESAALLLISFGAPAERLFVYTGGVMAWRAAGLDLVSP